MGADDDARNAAAEARRAAHEAKEAAQRARELAHEDKSLTGSSGPPLEIRNLGTGQAGDKPGRYDEDD